MILPEIRQQSVDDTRATLDIVAPATLVYFEGHFPGSPILPGVVQIGWAQALAQEIFAITFDVTGMRRLKFMNLIHPDREIRLDLGFDRNKQRLGFRYWAIADETEIVFSSGTLEVELR